MRRALVLITAITLAVDARGADPANSGTPSPPVTDPAAVAAHYHQVVARPEFRETDETLADLHWGDWLSQWVRHLVSRFQDFQYAGQFSNVARAVVVIFAALAVAGLFLLLRRLSRRRHERAAEETDLPEAGTTFLTPEQYETRLHRALENHDWHGAWLAAWLQLLARLEHRQLVAADRSRTNREYLAQLRAQRLPEEALPLLARMVDDYDRVIYGVRPIDEAGWTAFRDRIDEITLMLSLRERLTKELA
jgi:hypothetical protein